MNYPTNMFSSPTLQVSFSQFFPPRSVICRWRSCPPSSSTPSTMWSLTATTAWSSSRPPVWPSSRPWRWTTSTPTSWWIRRACARRSARNRSLAQLWRRRPWNRRAPNIWCEVGEGRSSPLLSWHRRLLKWWSEEPPFVVGITWLVF